jgi:hypothetical protein
MNLRKLSVNCVHHTRGKAARTRSGHEHTTCLPRLVDCAPLRSWVRDKAAAAGVNPDAMVI